VTSYSDEELVERYTRLSHTFPPERTFLAAQTDWLAGVRMLDLGVGAGRTTPFFAPKVKEYLGVDYAPEMVEVCREKFGQWPNVAFECLDARDLGPLPDAGFDFVFFSFNGIDCVDWEGRERVLREVERITRPGGRFFFSFHNARDLERLFTFQPRRDPRRLLHQGLRWLKMRRVNGSPARYRGQERFRLYDGGDAYKTLVSYMRPELQRARLEKSGWTDFVCYDMWDGAPMDCAEAWGSDQPWIYVQATRGAAAD
jgi:SAM-dependent methyltransferase